MYQNDCSLTTLIDRKNCASLLQHNIVYACALSSLSLIPGQGFQVALEALWVCCKRVSWPRVVPGLIVGRTLEHQMFNCFFGALTVWADGRVRAPDMVPTLVAVLTVCECCMDPGMWIAEVPILSDTPLVPFKSFGG